MRQQTGSEPSSQNLAFVMLNARPVDMDVANAESEGYYDPMSQTWIAPLHAQISSTYSTHWTAGGATSSDTTHRRDD